MFNDDLQEDEIYATLVEINQEPTELYKILKIENCVSGGGEAKQAIAEGYVLLNGEVETRKRKKVYAGDLVSFNGLHFQIALKGETESYEFVDSVPEELQSDQEIVSNSNDYADEKQIEDKPKKGKKARKAISF